jgi:hypothetical protein
MSDLFEAITAILAAENPSSSEVRGIIQGVRTKISDLEKMVDGVTKRMLDPRTDEATAKELRFDKGDASFLVERLTVGLSSLERALADTEHREEQERLLEAYEKTSRRMDDVRVAMETRYPQLAKEMALLFKISLDALLEVQAVNKNRPDGKPPISIPLVLEGEMPLPARVALPGHWRIKSDSLFEGGTSPTALLSLNR